MMIHPQYNLFKEKQEQLINQPNQIDPHQVNNIYDRYVNPILTRHHVPIEWRFDLNQETNPYFMERLMVNAVFNAGAIYFNDKFYLVVRLEGADRKSIFALASSPTGIDHFRFERLIEWDDLDPQETNRYDMRLVKHEDGYIYGLYCAEKKDLSVNDTSSALADVGLVRTTDLVTWTKLPNLKTKASQQRNVVLHPEFIEGHYGFYTRPQDGFIDVGSGGGIAFGLSKDMSQPNIDVEKVVSGRKYHTVYEYKNGQGPAPIKTEKGWLHLAHGVRNTADGLRYVLYMFATDLNDPTLVIAKPSGYFIAPYGHERTGDVSNVVFSNGWVTKGQDVFIYYASSDTRLHVATSTISKLVDYVFNTPEEVYRSQDSTEQRQQLIKQNQILKEKETHVKNHR
jgi:4-O-beta-D-mannosyl-D-glucose phosphorylase